MKKIFIIVILIAIILIAMGIDLWVVLKDLKDANPPEVTNNFLSVKPTQEPDTIMTLMGTVTKIFPGEKKFALRAEAVRNLFLTDKDFEIVVDGATKIRFTKLVNGQDVPLSFDDIKEGQNVIILCAENAKDKNSILAAGVDIVNGPADPFITGRTMGK